MCPCPAYEPTLAVPSLRSSKPYRRMFENDGGGHSPACQPNDPAQDEQPSQLVCVGAATGRLRRVLRVGWALPCAPAAPLSECQRRSSRQIGRASCRERV